MKTLTRDDTVHDVGYVLASDAHAVEEERDELRRDIAALLNALPNGAHDVTEGVGTIQAMRENLAREKQALQNAAKDCFRLIREGSEMREENEAMREAIKEAHDVLILFKQAGFGMSTNYYLQGSALIKSTNTLDKLKPFLK